MAVVVGAPDVYDLVKAALLELISVIRDIGGKVGIEAVCTAQDVVLELKLFDILLALTGGAELVPEYPRGVQPQGSVLFVGKARLGELRYAVGNIAAFVQARFVEPS